MTSLREDAIARGMGPVLSLQAAISRELGMRTRTAENRETEAMTTSAAVLLRADSGRLAALVVNLGAEAVFIRPNGIPSATVGIRLAPTGGSLSMNFREDFSIVGKEWQGLTASATSTLYVAEELLEA